MLEGINNDVEFITTIATALKARLDASNGLYSVSDLRSVRGYVSETHRTLTTLEKKLSGLRSTDSSSRQLKRARLLRKKTETDKLLQSLQRHKLSLILGLVLLGMYVRHILITRTNVVLLEFAC